MNNNNTYWTDRQELLTRAAIAEAEVAELRARIAELEAADQWRPISEPPGAAGWYLGWNGYRIQIIQYLPEYERSEIDWPWWDWYDDEVEITHWATLLAPPGVMAQERGE